MEYLDIGLSSSCGGLPVLRLTPLIGFAPICVPHPLDVRGMSRIKLPRALDRLPLRRKDITRSVRICPTYRVVTLRSPLHEELPKQSRCFNDLQRHRVPNSATAFDNRRRIRLKTKIPLTKGRLPEACREVERVRCPRADLQSAPGRLGYQSPGIMTGMGGASLDWDRRRRVTPVQTTSQEAWPEAEPSG